MDDLIIIILTLIVAGVGALGQLRKKKKVSGAEQQTKAPESFWDLIQGGVNESQPMSEIDIEEPVFVGKDLESVKETEVVLKKRTSQFKTSEVREVTDNELVVKAKKKKLKSILNEDFSLRKAVVYSEILNRKYN